mgnify:CR=1 FL=1
MKLLIVYGSTEGQTKKICEFLKVEAEKRGHQVAIEDSTEKPESPKAYNAVIIGASVHMGKYQSSIKHYVQSHLAALGRIPTVFLSVSLTAVSDDAESWDELEAVTDQFLDQTQWHPDYIEQVAGALRYTEYNWLKRFLMRMIAKNSGQDTDTTTDHEYTDWDQVRGIIDKLESEVEKLQDVT